MARRWSRWTAMGFCVFGTSTPSRGSIAFAASPIATSRWRNGTHTLAPIRHIDARAQIYRPERELLQTPVIQSVLSVKEVFEERAAGAGAYRVDQIAADYPSAEDDTSTLIWRNGSFG